MTRTKDSQHPSSIKPTTLHSPTITQAKQAKPLTAEEILAAASPTVQDSHWDAIVDHAIQLGRGQ